MRRNNKYEIILKEISTMNPLTTSGVPVADDIQKRLNQGKKEFETAVQTVFDALMKMSALDLSLGENSRLISQVSGKLFEAAEEIREVAVTASESTTEVTAAHENLTENIEKISYNLEDILKGITKSEGQLEEIVVVAGDTIDSSKDMKSDMDKLVHEIGRASCRERV